MKIFKNRKYFCRQNCFAFGLALFSGLYMHAVSYILMHLPVEKLNKIIGYISAPDIIFSLAYTI
jgi:hypothetical protein